MNMPEVRRQNRQAAFDVLTGPVPLDQGLDGKSGCEVFLIAMVRVFTISVTGSLWKLWSSGIGPAKT